MNWTDNSPIVSAEVIARQPGPLQIRLVYKNGDDRLLTFASTIPAEQLLEGFRRAFGESTK